MGTTAQFECPVPCLDKEYAIYVKHFLFILKNRSCWVSLVRNFTARKTFEVMLTTLLLGTIAATLYQGNRQ
jgi:hypothetical protein